MPAQFIALVGSASRTATGTGDTIDLSKHAVATGRVPQLRIQSQVTAVSGTNPSVTVIIEDSVDGENWNTIDTFTAQTAVNRAVRNITTLFNPRRVRARWTISGTNPSLTFSVKAILV